jgi:predicted anti-sigma-YlaC factor YlaD
MAAARIGLVMVAVTQLLLWVPVLLFGHDRGAPVHVAHEMGAFDVAVAIGFLVAARRPGRAMGMLSLVGVAAGLLVVTAAVDLVAARTDVSDEAPHLLVVAGWLLLWRLAAIAPPTWERPQAVSAALGSAWAALTRRQVAARQPAVSGNLSAGSLATEAASVSLPVPDLAADRPDGPASRQPDEAVG